MFWKWSQRHLISSSYFLFQKRFIPLRLHCLCDLILTTPLLLWTCTFSCSSTKHCWRRNVTGWPASLGLPWNAGSCSFVAATQPSITPLDQLLECLSQLPTSCKRKSMNLVWNCLTRVNLLCNMAHHSNTKSFRDVKFPHELAELFFLKLKWSWNLKWAVNESTVSKISARCTSFPANGEKNPSEGTLPPHFRSPPLYLLGSWFALEGHPSPSAYSAPWR